MSQSGADARAINAATTSRIYWELGLCGCRNLDGSRCGGALIESEGRVTCETCGNAVLSSAQASE